MALRLPQSCAFGAKFSIEHSFSHPKSGFPSICHNEIRDLTASLSTEVCHKVEIEPTALQPVTGERFILASSNADDGAYLDVTANGFWEGQWKIMLKQKFSTPMPLLAVPLLLGQFIENMRWLRSDLTRPGYLRLSIALFSTSFFSATGEIHYHRMIVAHNRDQLENFQAASWASNLSLISSWLLLGALKADQEAFKWFDMDLGVFFKFQVVPHLLHLQPTGSRYQPWKCMAYV